MKYLKHRYTKLFIFIACAFSLITFLLWPQVKDAYLLLSGKTTNVPETQKPSNISPGKHTFAGEYVCLPSKKTDGPVTLECALGMLADNGSYFALDTQALDPNVAMIPTGSRIRVEGTVVLAEALSSDHWKKYNIAGVIRVEVFEKI